MEIETITASLDELHVQKDTHSKHLPSSSPLLQASDQFQHSNIFTSESGVNNLCTAAASLFSIVEQLLHNKKEMNLASVEEGLLHEVQAFTARSVDFGYSTQVVYAARYILCAWVDEALLNHESLPPGAWEHYKLLNRLQPDAPNGEQFFVILERASREAVTYVDLLELIYFCLSLGYLGEYRNKTNPHQSVALIIDNLYRTIRRERGNISKRVHVNTPVPLLTYSRPRKKRFKLLLLPIGALLVIFGLYTFMDLHLKSISSEIKSQLSLSRDIQ